MSSKSFGYKQCMINSMQVGINDSNLHQDLRSLLDSSRASGNSRFFITPTYNFINCNIYAKIHPQLSHV